MGRNVSLAGDHEAASQSAATNDSFPVFGGVGYNAAEEGGAAAAASTANATQTADCEQVSAALTGRPLICTWRIRPTSPDDTRPLAQQQNAASAAELLGLNHTNDEIIKELVNSIGSSRELQDAESESHF